jgi:hypothetical protein
MPLDTANFFLFGLSGFVTVWTFRKFSKTKGDSEFEYLALSFFWGITNFVLVSWVDHWSPKALDSLNKLTAYPFAFGFALSSYGFILGWLGSKLVRTNWFKNGMKWLNEIL